MTTFDIVPRGAFSLRESVEFGFGQRHSTVLDGTMRLAFCVDHHTEQVGAVLTQDASGVHGELVGDAPVDAVRAQVARMLSLDVDARAYEEVGARDPVVARALAAAPGLRPPLFHSPYEAAAWCVLSLRWSARQAAAVRERFATAHGRVFDVAGERMAAFPTPAQLLTVAEFPGIPPVKIERLHAVARAAQAGALDAEKLRAAEPDAATAGLRQIPGIGPFSASLIVLRASGVCDVPIDQEPRLAELVGQLYGLPAVATPADMLRIGEAWRPFRTWVGVLLRAAGARIAVS
ncbi:DNA-3-methyladenine glycosylase family protein [Pseudonocardia sp. GCM10023141]|uniref:DNA-3-methyladenine glycosylase family protein n=1 Tax=Pseudonocardia sp. GCM10023141 TaxID=3252653 RepID=UPI00360FEDD9